MIIALASFIPAIPQPAMAVEFLVRINQDVFFPGDNLVLYGQGAPDDVFLVRVYDQSGKALRLDSIPADEDGFFRQTIMEWQEPTINLPLGLYIIEINSSLGAKNTQQLDVTFAEEAPTSPVPQPVPATHSLAVKLDSPAQITKGTPFRIFVQVTFDNALVNSDDPEALLGYSHVHSDNSTINIAEFTALHPGLYYADVLIDREGSYVIHVQAFHRGILSHDSRVVAASVSSISSIQDSVNQLNDELGTTNQELSRLEGRLDETRATLDDTKAAITGSVEGARQSIREEIGAMTDASGQINAIILPVLALISVIIALQISLFARIRASYR